MTIRVLCLLLTVAFLSALGCRREEQIESYNVPKKAVRQVAPAAAFVQAADRMLAAVLTRSRTFWFFKLTVDRGLVAAQRDKFASFLKSVRFAGSGATDGNQ